MLRECLHDLQGRTKVQKRINTGIHLAAAGLFQFEQGFAQSSKNIISIGFVVIAGAIAGSRVASVELPQPSDGQQQDEGTRSVGEEPELD